MTRFNASAHISYFFVFIVRWRSEIILPLAFRFFLRRISLPGYKRHLASIRCAMLGLNVGFLSIILSIVSRNVTIFYSSIDRVRFLLFARSSNGRTYLYLTSINTGSVESFVSDYSMKKIARIFLDEISFTHRRYACAQRSFFFFFLTIRNDNCICIYAIALKICQIYTVLTRSRHLRYTVGETRHIDE